MKTGDKGNAMIASAAVLQVPVRATRKQDQNRAVSGAAVVTAAKAEPASDERLFSRAALGDRSALGELIGRYEDFLYGLLLRMTGGDTHRAEDFFQDAFLHAMKAAGTFDAKKAFKPWIAAIALNVVRDDARKRKVRSEVALENGRGEDLRLLPELADLNEGPSECAERRDEEHMIGQALGRLTDLEREVILLHFYNGMTLQETAESLSAPVGTVKSRLHAALTRLSGILERSRL